MKTFQHIVAPILLTVWALISFVLRTDIYPDISEQIESVIRSINLWIIIISFAVIIIGSLRYIYRRYSDNTDKSTVPKILIWGLIIFFYILALKSIIIPFDDIICCGGGPAPDIINS